MNVRVCIQFEVVSDKELAAMQSLGLALTNQSKSIRVFADLKRPDWLLAEFTMTTEPQYSAVDRIDAEIRYWVSSRLDSAIQFPRSDAEIARAKRKAERRREKRNNGKIIGR